MSRGVPCGRGLTPAMRRATLSVGITLTPACLRDMVPYTEALPGLAAALQKALVAAR